MTKCSCIKKNFDFQFDAIDTKIILFQDLSDWMQEDHYIKPEYYTIQIKQPHSKKFYEKKVDAVSYNKITSEDIGLSGSLCLPEGIYTIKTESCGNVFMRYKALTPDLECRLSCALLQGVDPLTVAKLEEQIKSIHYNVERDRAIEASKIYKIVKREIDLLDCNCNCCQ